LAYVSGEWKKNLIKGHFLEGPERGLTGILFFFYKTVSLYVYVKAGREEFGADIL
jgi:hypothetical protein